MNDEDEYVAGTVTHEALIDAIEIYLFESEKFEEKGIKASAPRARKALGDIARLTKKRRAEIQERKHNM